MPSTIGYATLSKKIDSKSSERLIIQELVASLSSKSFKDKSPDEVAEYIYDMSYQIVARLGISLEDYYRAVAIMLSRNMIPFDCNLVHKSVISRFTRAAENILDSLSGKIQTVIKV